MNRLTLVLALALPAALACSSEQKMGEGQLTSQGPVVQYPEWVNKGSGAFGGEKKVFYGVGSASGIRNQSLARSTNSGAAWRLMSTGRISIARSQPGGRTSMEERSTLRVSETCTRPFNPCASRTFTTARLMAMSGDDLIEIWILPATVMINSAASTTRPMSRFTLAAPFGRCPID